jgi:signal transduction histidine kinase
VYLPGGELLGAHATPTVAVRLAERGRSVTVETAAGREIALAVTSPSGGTAVVRMLVPTDELTRGVDRAWLVLAVLAVALLLLAVLVADRLARGMVRSTTDIARVSRLLATGVLDARAGHAGPPEIRAVAEALNQLAGRIQHLVDQAREEAADLSHRLRTPLTALRMEVDQLPAGAERLTGRIDDLERAVTAVIRDARAEPVRTRLCDAAMVVREQVDFWAPLAEDENRPMRVRITEQPLPVAVGAADLRACVDALLNNVFIHTPVGTPLAVVLERHESMVRLVIIDQGPGFAQADPVRRGTSGTNSTGLGLDIARRKAHAAGGSFRIDSSPRGARVVLELLAGIGNVGVQD